MSKHTKGPWQFQKEKRKNRSFGGLTQSFPALNEVISLGQKTSFGLQKIIVSDEEENLSDADARLIAAAPELLEALKNAMPVLANAKYRLKVNDWAEGDPNECDDSKEGRDAIKAYKLALRSLRKAINGACKAIAKAEGDSNE